MSIHMNGPHASRGVAVAGTILLSTALTACISTDATRDRSDAVALANTRLDDASLPSRLNADPTAIPIGWPAVIPLDPDHAVEIAMARDAGVRQAMTSIDRARADLAQADRAPNPMVQVAIGFPIDGLSGAPAMAALAQQVTWLWTRPYRISAADAERQASIFTAGDAIIALDAEVRRRHAIAVNATLRAAVDREYADSTGRVASVIRQLLEVGEASRIDLDRMLVESSEAMVAADAAESSARLARLDLLAAMGMPEADPDFDLAGSAPGGLTNSTPSESRITELAATARLDVAASGCRVLATESRHGLAETRRLPQVEAALGWNRNFADRDALLPGARISIPIFDDGGPAIAAAEADLRKAMLQLLETRRSAIAEARHARERLSRASTRRIGYEQSVLAPAARAERLAVQAYEEGVVDLTVVLLAQRRRIEADRSFLAFQLEEVTSNIDLLESVGGSFESPPGPPTPPERDDARVAHHLTAVEATP